MERPALKRLMADVEAGKVDCTIVYKVDRLSRSLLDFARILEAFETHQVSFVSVTQQINSATSMGRLMLNVLLSFAQFEREIIAERTRDKIAATRRKGKWSGGRPLLGYDVDPRGQRLAVNAEEAERVRGGLRAVPGTRVPAAGGAGAGSAGLVQQALADALGQGERRRPVQQGGPAPAADQRAVRGPGALQGRGPRRRAARPGGPGRLPPGAGAAPRRRPRRRSAGRPSGWGRCCGVCCAACRAAAP